MVKERHVVVVNKGTVHCALSLLRKHSHQVHKYWDEKYGRRAAETLFTFSFRVQARKVVSLKIRDYMNNTRYTL